MLNVFIDTNILLGFYDFGNSALEELKKLVELEKFNEIKLYMTSQVVDEFKRNREKQIKQVLKGFTDQKIDESLPILCKSSEGLQDRYQKAIKEFKEAKKELEKDVRDRIVKRKLSADEIVWELFRTAKEIEIDDEIIRAAQKRMFLGNPPGKNGTSGDAINWETLLKVVPDGEELYLISGDGDFQSVIDRKSFNTFLKNEWKVKKNGAAVHYFESLGGFCEKKFPAIKVSEQIAKANAIKLLVESRTFKETRAKLSNLSAYAVFTDSEAKEIAMGVVSNSQIFAICDEPSTRNRLRNYLKTGSSTSLHSLRYQYVAQANWISPR